MGCLNCIRVPLVFFFRCVVYYLPCLFKHRVEIKVSLSDQLRQNYSRRGGFHTNYYRTEISTRDTFYALLGLFMKRRGTEEALKIFQRLSRDMTADGQVPSAYVFTWSGDKPVYKKESVPIVDANMYYIILAWKCYDSFPKEIEHGYLHCQRAYRWLETFVFKDTLHEPVGASWQNTIKHDGPVLLSNVLHIQTIRSMECLACVLKDSRQQELFIAKHKQALSKWVPEIYKTQETLPRILSIHWNMVRTDFIQSFDQELQCPLVPLRTAGPVKDETTWSAWVYGRQDLHTTIVWPWVGYLYMCVLCSQRRTSLAQKWWAKYTKFNHHQTLFDIYDKDTHFPIRRAFLKSMPSDSKTLSLRLAAQHFLHGTVV